MEVNQGFALQGDGAHNSALLLPDLVNDGVQLLVYTGNAGASNECSLSQVLCLRILFSQIWCVISSYASNSFFIHSSLFSQGNERWVEALDTKFHKEFTTAKTIPWITLEGGKVAGTVRSSGGSGFTAGNVSFVTVHEAGHMVPYDRMYILLLIFTILNNLISKTEPEAALVSSLLLCVARNPESCSS